MDVFSLGCVLAELFTDGAALFDLSQVLQLLPLLVAASSCAESGVNPTWRHHLFFSSWTVALTSAAGCTSPAD